MKMFDNFEIKNMTDKDLEEKQVYLTKIIGSAIIKREQHKEQLANLENETDKAIKYVDIIAEYIAFIAIEQERRKGTKIPEHIKHPIMK